MERLGEKIYDLGLESLVKIKGLVPEVKEALLDADWLVLPSVNRPDPVVFSEALASGELSMVTKSGYCHRRGEWLSMRSWWPDCSKGLDRARGWLRWCSKKSVIRCEIDLLVRLRETLGRSMVRRLEMPEGGISEDRKTPFVKIN